MAADPQGPSRHAGDVVRRVLLRRNIAIDPETAQLVAAAVQACFASARPPGRRAGARVFRRLRAAVLIRHRLSAWCLQLPDNREPGRAAVAAFAQVASRHGGRYRPRNGGYRAILTHQRKVLKPARAAGHRDDPQPD